MGKDAPSKSIVKIMSFKDVYYIIYDDIIRNYSLFKSKRSNIHGIILMYHHVIIDENMPLGTCVCTVDEFKNSLDEIAKYGYKFVSLDEANEIMKKGDNTKFVSITFDDVPNDFYENAYPVLLNKNFPFTLFLTVDYLNKEGYLNKEQVIELCKNPLCTIGAHTLSHPQLRNCIYAEREIYESKEALENLISKEIKYFAYPYGKMSSVSRKIINMVADAGFICAFGTSDAPLSDISGRDIYYLPRIVYQRGCFKDKFKYSFFAEYVVRRFLKHK